MPLGLQVQLFTKLFLKANKNLGDPSAELDNIDWQTLGPEATCLKNLENLKNEYAQYLWEVPKSEEELSSEESSVKKRSDKPIWERRTSKDNKSDIYTTTVPIKLHKVRAKGKKYAEGRIQVSVNRRWIGRKAKIVVQIHRPKSVFREKT